MKLLTEAPGASAPATELTFQDIFATLLRRKWIILGTLFFFFSIGILLSIFGTRKYQAIGELQVERSSTDGLGLGSETGFGSVSDALSESLGQQTQASILQSDSLALKVIKDLHLESTAGFRSDPNAGPSPLDFILPDGPPDPPNASLENAPKRRAHVLKVFDYSLKVKPLPGTRLVEVRFMHQDPKVAADVVNDLMKSLVDFTFETRAAATAQASGWLSGQLTDLRKNTEELQAKVVRLQREAGVFSTGSEDATGKGQTYSSVLDTLQQSTTALAQAQSNRILKGAVYEVVKTGDPDLLSSLSGISAGGASAGVSNSLALIQNLRAQETTLRSQLDQLSAKFGPAYPKIEEVRSSMNAVQKGISDELQRIAGRAKNDFVVAQQVEDRSRAVFEAQKHQADVLNDKAIEYAIVRNEADGSRALYDGLLKRLKEAGILEGLRSTNITVVDPGRIPARPARPQVLIYLAGSFAVGLLFGCFGALMLDSMDNKIHNTAEIEQRMGIHAFGTLPLHKAMRASLSRVSAPWLATPSNRPGVMKAITAGNGNGAIRLMALNEPQSPYVEAVRALRTSLFLSQGGVPPQVILVTSSIPGEGKTMLAVNLAVVLAQNGKKVLLVDADLRRPALNRTLDLMPNGGLSSLLAGQAQGADVLTIDGIPGLHVLQAGAVPPFPAELLGSEQMRVALNRWRQEYDFIVFEGAPVLPVTDSVVLSGMADVTLLLARYKVTDWQALQRGYRLLHFNAGIQKVGVVLNAVTPASSTENYYGYETTRPRARRWGKKA